MIIEHANVAAIVEKLIAAEYYESPLGIPYWRWFIGGTGRLDAYIYVLTGELCSGKSWHEAIAAMPIYEKTIGRHGKWEITIELLFCDPAVLEKHKSPVRKKIREGTNQDQQSLFTKIR